MSRKFLAVAVLALGVTLTAQPSFRSGVDLVMIPVTVTAGDPAAVLRELGPPDFRIFEDGVAQELSILSHEPRPLSLCILLDSSPSMASGRQALAMRTIDTLLDGLRPEDEASMLFFSSKVRLALPWTPARAVPPISWIEWRLSLGTALIDAMKEALRLIEQAHNPLPVIVVVSDGGENASGTPLSGLVASRRQSETLVYGIDLQLPLSKRAPLVNRAFADFLPNVVGDSGGTVYSVRSPEAGEAAALAFLEELRAQYTLGYAPKRPLDGKYRQVKVETTNKNLIVRHRGGYLAQPAGPRPQ